MRGYLRKARRLDGHVSANLYNAIDNLIHTASDLLDNCQDQDSQQAAALRGKIRAYRECRQLLLDSHRYRPRLLGDPSLDTEEQRSE